MDKEVRMNSDMQSCVLERCFRHNIGGEHRVEILLVSRRSGKESYTIPAGKFDSDADLDMVACASRETQEEAGVDCERIADLGWYESRSKTNEKVQTKYFLMRCVRERADWQEDQERIRYWCVPEEATRQVSWRSDLASVMKLGLETLQSYAEGRALSPARQPQDSDSDDPFEHLPTEEGETEEPNNPSPPVTPRIAKRHVRWTPSSLSDKVESPARSDDARRTCESVAVQDVTGEHYQLYPHQVGGHFCLVKPCPGSSLEVEHSGVAGGSGHIKGSRVLLKPFDEFEMRFYRQVREKFTSLVVCTPCFHGTKTLRREQIPQPGGHSDTSQWNSMNFRRYIVLEDLTGDALRPCSMDIKMGCRQRSARHSERKRVSMTAKGLRTTTASLGFRICGMQAYCPEDGTSKYHDKYWCQNVKADTMLETIDMFFPKVGGVRTSMLDSILSKLADLRKVILSLPGLRFWSSSLLLGFDGALLLNGTPETFLESIQMRMIDFAHTANVGGDEPDREFLCGLENLCVYLEALRHESSPNDRIGWIQRHLVPPPEPDIYDVEQEAAARSLECRWSDVDDCFVEMKDV